MFSSNGMLATTLGCQKLGCFKRLTIYIFVCPTIHPHYMHSTGMSAVKDRATTGLCADGQIDSCH